MKPHGRQWITPDQAANGDAAQFKGPDQTMSFPGWDRILQLVTTLEHARSADVECDCAHCAHRA